MISFSETVERETLSVKFLADSSEVVTSAIERIGDWSSSEIVNNADSSDTLLLLAFDRLILTVSLFSSITSERMGTIIDPEVSPAEIVNVPDVST